MDGFTWGKFFKKHHHSWRVEEIFVRSGVPWEQWDLCENAGDVSKLYVIQAKQTSKLEKSQVLIATKTKAKSIEVHLTLKVGDRPASRPALKDTKVASGSPASDYDPAQLPKERDNKATVDLWSKKRICLQSSRQNIADGNSLSASATSQS